MPQETFQSVFLSIYNLINNTAVFGVNSVDFALTRDSDIKWPVNPPPYALIIPHTWSHEPEDVGGGRFAKTWAGEVEIAIVVREIVDMSYKDTQAFLTNDSSMGAFLIAQNLIDKLEQSYPLDGDGKLSLAELPNATRVEEPFRFIKSNEYIGLPVFFKLKWWQLLPSTLP